MWGDYELTPQVYVIKGSTHYQQFIISTEQRFVKLYINMNQSEAQLQRLFEIKFGDDFKKDAVIKCLFECAISLCDGLEKISSRAKKLPGADMKVSNPVSKDLESLYYAIITLNDTHKWTREQIADWIETLDEVPAFNTQESEVTIDEKDLTILADEVRLPQSAFGKRQQHI